MKKYLKLIFVLLFSLHASVESKIKHDDKPTPEDDANRKSRKTRTKKVSKKVHSKKKKKKKKKKEEQAITTSRPVEKYMLIFAVLSGALPLVKNVLKQDEKLIYETDTGGNTVLHEAARKNYIEITQYLLSKIPKNEMGRALIAKTNKHGKTAADIALEAAKIAQEDDDIVEFNGLKEIYASLQKALRDRTKKRGGDLINESEAKNEHKTIHQYAREGNLKEIQALAKNNKEILKALDNQGNTPLHCAAEGNQLKIVKYLLDQYGNDVDTLMRDNKQGKKAAALAAAKGHSRVFASIGKRILDLFPPF